MENMNITSASEMQDALSPLNMRTSQDLLAPPNMLAPQDLPDPSNMRTPQGQCAQHTPIAQRTPITRATSRNPRNPQKKVGIMGGTFDPIHTGHLILGESAYQQFSLDKVLFMPSGNPPHKKGREGASNEERVEIVRRAIASNPHFELSLEEMHEEGYTYTKETLRRLTTEHPDTEYYFIMGADSLMSFETWREPEKICRLCVIVAAVRDHLSFEQMDGQIKHLKEIYQADIRKLETPNIDIASHTIREWLAQGRSCRYYVPEEVRIFLEENRVYNR